MTAEEFGSAYSQGLARTTRLLIARGLWLDVAQETAQAAWAKGWEKRHQLRDSSMLMTWINTIALNIHRNALRREPVLQDLVDVPAPPQPYLAPIDVHFILRTCKENERFVLQRHYLEQRKTSEIALEKGLTVTAVRLRLLRARRAVAKTLAATENPTRNSWLDGRAERILR
jgi:DNA-directed RNA polymerase specialized sigma24 family protein